MDGKPPAIASEGLRALALFMPGWKIDLTRFGNKRFRNERDDRDPSERGQIASRSGQKSVAAWNSCSSSLFVAAHVAHLYFSSRSTNGLMHHSSVLNFLGLIA
jgi:hypothetical protein